MFTKYQDVQLTLAWSLHQKSKEGTSTSVWVLYKDASVDRWRSSHSWV